jgi:integrase
MSWRGLMTRSRRFKTHYDVLSPCRLALRTASSAWGPPSGCVMTIEPRAASFSWIQPYVRHNSDNSWPSTHLAWVGVTVCSRSHACSHTRAPSRRQSLPTTTIGGLFRSLSTPPEWLEWALRWRCLSTHEPSTIRGMFSTILVAGRWAAEKHPEKIGPDKWTRDMAAEYVADTMTATMGQWAGANRNRTRWGQPLSAVGKAQRMDSLRSFFGDLIEWEWIHAHFDPKRVLSLPLSIRAQIGPNPRIIDDVAWAKLMAAGVTLNAEDLNGYGTPAARQVGHRDTYYPIEMVRALVAVWLFGGCRIDEIRRLEVDCIVSDEGTDEKTGTRYPICLLRVPQNKTSGPLNKPVDPVVGQVVDAWKLVWPHQPLLEDRKTHERREYLFCFRGQLVGTAYLNNQIIPALCRNAGLPDSDSRGALTSHRARDHRDPAAERG